MEKDRRSRTRFEQLCAEYEKVQQDFRRFERECHSFAVQLVRNFIAYFQIPPSQFSLYRVDQNGEFELVRPAVINAIRHAEDSYWHFGIGLTVSSSPEEFPQDLILIHIFVRKDAGDKFLARIEPNPTEYEINKNEITSFNKFFDFIENEVIESYRQGFQKFIGHDTTRKLGYDQHKGSAQNTAGFIKS